MEGARARMRELSYDEVEAATGGFAPQNLVGKGSHGCVYRAKLCGRGGRTVVVAVKRASHGQGEAKLANEIAVLSAAPRHPGVVGVVGVVVAAAPVRLPPPPLLVMEFMPDGSLHDLLHRSPRPPPWPRRVGIALDVASAVRALHAAAIVHRDVKSANVLLGRDGRARLADFGLAVRVPPRAGAPPAPAGTIGYLDPCYTEPARLGPASDVFSLGVVLLELVSGRKVMDVDACPSSIVSWAAPLIAAGRGREVLDARVAASPPDASAARVLAVAARCVSESVEGRPCMAEVVSELRAALEGAGGWRGPRGYAHRVVEGACRRVVAWGRRHVRSRRVSATNKVVECTEHSSGAPEPPKDPTTGAPPSHSNNNSQMTCPNKPADHIEKTQLPL